MVNPWFQKGKQSLLQLPSTGAYTVLWNLDIRSCSAKQWIYLKLLHVVWKQQNQCLIQTHLGNLWHHFDRCYCDICCWVRETMGQIISFWWWCNTVTQIWFWESTVVRRSCTNLLGPYHCHTSNFYSMQPSAFQSFNEPSLNLDIRSWSAKQWIYFKLLHVLWKKQN